MIRSSSQPPLPPLPSTSLSPILRSPAISPLALSEPRLAYLHHFPSAPMRPLFVFLLTPCLPHHAPGYIPARCPCGTLMPFRSAQSLISDCRLMLGIAACSLFHRHLLLASSNTCLVPLASPLVLAHLYKLVTGLPETCLEASL